MGRSVITARSGLAIHGHCVMVMESDMTNLRQRQWIVGPHLDILSLQTRRLEIETLVSLVVQVQEAEEGEACLRHSHMNATLDQ